jgi:hypothetical protein
MGIPLLQQYVPVLFHYALQTPEFHRGEATGSSDSHGIEPEFALELASRDVNVGALSTIRHVEEEAVRA